MEEVVVGAAMGWRRSSSSLAHTKFELSMPFAFFPHSPSYKTIYPASLYDVDYNVFKKKPRMTKHLLCSVGA